MIWFIIVGILCFTLGAYVSYHFCKDHDISHADKLADIQLISTDSDSILEFIRGNISSLSNPIRESLISRVEELKAEKFIQEDDLSKKIDSLEKKIIDESFASKNRKRVKVNQDKEIIENEEFLYPWTKQEFKNENKY